MNHYEIKEYQNLDMTAILALYESVGWVNYTKNPGRLESALQHSLKILAAWDGNTLIGWIRAVGDGYSLLYIQDLIVLPDYQRKGIGKKLVLAMDELFPEVYQKVLLTDNQPKTIGFYQNCGFVPSETYQCSAFVKYHL